MEREHCDSQILIPPVRITSRMSLKLLVVFAITEFLLSLTPGPAVLLVISQAIRAGFKSSTVGIIGILTGNTFYFVLSALGLATLLSTSFTLFQVVRWLGAAYLILVGIRMLISSEVAKEGEISTARTRQSLALFSQGLVTQLSNPKALVFFTALLPQFVSPGGKIFAQFVTLGLISIAVEFRTCFNEKSLILSAREQSQMQPLTKGSSSSLKPYLLVKQVRNSVLVGSILIRSLSTDCADYADSGT
jgi:homoserine/homoserine lactone efflux protein